jgi:WD40 repeat protein
LKLWKIPPPLPKVQADRATISRLIKELDSEAFAEREVAQRELRELGATAKPALEEAAKSDSAELRFRARALLERMSFGDLQPAQVLPRSTFDVHAVAFSPDGEWLVSGRQFDKPGNLIVYKMGDSPRPRILPHQHGAWTVAFTPDGKQLVTGRRDGQVSCWDFEP